MGGLHHLTSQVLELSDRLEPTKLLGCLVITLVVMLMALMTGMLTSTIHAKELYVNEYAKDYVNGRLRSRILLALD